MGSNDDHTCNSPFAPFFSPFKTGVETFSSTVAERNGGRLLFTSFTYTAGFPDDIFASKISRWLATWGCASCSCCMLFDTYLGSYATGNAVPLVSDPAPLNPVAPNDKSTTPEGYFLPSPLC